MGLVLRLIGVALALGGTVTLFRLLLRTPQGIVPAAVFVWCVLILALTVLLVVRSGWAQPGEHSLLRAMAFGRAFVVLYGAVFLGGLILTIIAFVML